MRLCAVLGNVEAWQDFHRGYNRDPNLTALKRRGFN